MRELRPRWFALTVKHQHERGVEAALSSCEIEAFVPVYRAWRPWSDRRKELEIPLFPGYVFGFFPAPERVRVLNTPGVGRVVGFGGVPAPVADEEIANIRAAIRSNLALRPWPFLKTGDRVRIERGPLRGVEGTLLREKTSLRLVIGIELLQRAVAVEVDAEMVVSQ